MSNIWKIIIAVVIVAIVVGGGVYLWQRFIKAPTIVSTTFTDQKSGITFMVPEGWTAGSDPITGEITVSDHADFGKRDALPSLTTLYVTFDSFQGKNAWLTAKASIDKTAVGASLIPSEVLKEKGTMEIGRYPTTYGIWEQVADAYRYTEYYVDGGKAWYKLTSSDPSNALVGQIIHSVSFGIESNSLRTLQDYFANRKQFLNNEMPKDKTGMDKTPEALGLKQLATVAVTCPANSNLGTPCEGTLLILSKDPIHSGNQEFYLAFTMGTGYVYYGPFTDDLTRLVNESKTIKSIERTN